MDWSYDRCFGALYAKKLILTFVLLDGACDSRGPMVYTIVSPAYRPPLKVREQREDGHETRSLSKRMSLCAEDLLSAMQRTYETLHEIVYLVDFVP